MNNLRIWPLCLMISDRQHYASPHVGWRERGNSNFYMRGVIFPTLSVSILNQKVPKLIKAAGIDKHITFHCFRHTFAMRLLDKGIDIPTNAFLLGHKFLGSSLSYLHCTRDHLEEVIAKLER